MLSLVLLVLAGTAYVWARLAGGQVDLTQSARSILQLVSDDQPREDDDILLSSTAGGQEGQSQSQPANPTQAKPQATPTLAAEKRYFTLTMGGTVAVEEKVRKSAYSADSEKYDFTDIMMLLSGQVRGDFRGVFLENILDDEGKISNTVVPESAADMLKAGGFNLAASGFAKAWDREMAGITSTREALSARGMTPTGIRDQAGVAGLEIYPVGGIKVAIGQYTSTVSASVRKSMAKKDADNAIPEADPERIAKDIQLARDYGAECVVILLNWGKVGSKTPDKTQKALAQTLANAGADLIIGCGSRTPQTAEYFEEEGGSGHRTLCVYSLGTLLSDYRDSINRLASYLLQVTVTVDGGKIQAIDASYLPVYTWRYKQDGKYYYRCLIAGENHPDGMDSEQLKNLEKARTVIDELLAGTPLTPAEI